MDDRQDKTRQDYHRTTTRQSQDKTRQPQDKTITSQGKTRQVTRQDKARHKQEQSQDKTSRIKRQDKTNHKTRQDKSQDRDKSHGKTRHAQDEANTGQDMCSHNGKHVAFLRTQVKICVAITDSTERTERKSVQVWRKAMGMGEATRL